MSHSDVSHHVYAAIDLSLSDTNWQAILQVVDDANTNSYSQTTIYEILRTRLKTKDSSRSRINKTVFLSLELLDSLMKNCPDFKYQVGNEAFMKNLVKIGGERLKSDRYSISLAIPAGVIPTSKEGLREAIHQKVAKLIQDWGKKYTDYSDPLIFRKTYETLLARGIKFPVQQTSSSPPRVRSQSQSNLKPQTRTQTQIPPDIQSSFTEIKERALLLKSMLEALSDRENPSQNAVIQELVVCFTQKATLKKWIDQYPQLLDELTCLVFLLEDLSRLYDEKVRASGQVNQTPQIAPSLAQAGRSGSSNLALGPPQSPYAQPQQLGYSFQPSQPQQQGYNAQNYSQGLDPYPQTPAFSSQTLQSFQSYPMQQPQYSVQPTSPNPFPSSFVSHSSQSLISPNTSNPYLTQPNQIPQSSQVINGPAGPVPPFSSQQGMNSFAPPPSTMYPSQSYASQALPPGGNLGSSNYPPPGSSQFSGSQSNSAYQQQQLTSSNNPFSPFVQPKETPMSPPMGPPMGTQMYSQQQSYSATQPQNQTQFNQSQFSSQNPYHQSQYPQYQNPFG